MSELHISWEKCNLWTGRSCIFPKKTATHIKNMLEKCATHVENRSKLHICWEKCNLYQKQVGVAHFSRKVQLVSRPGRSCTFIEKSATHIKKRLELHIFEKSATRVETRSKLHFFFEKSVTGWSCTFLGENKTYWITICKYFEKDVTRK
jgi:hypothetical protein